ncbi:hypothetical protein WJX79_006350 [Trebouxia sp. C0005]
MMMKHDGNDLSHSLRRSIGKLRRRHLYFLCSAEQKDKKGQKASQDEGEATYTAPEPAEPGAGGVQRACSREDSQDFATVSTKVGTTVEAAA